MILRIFFQFCLVMAMSTVAVFSDPLVKAAADHLVFEPSGDGVEPKGKHIVLLAGDEEYKSEEAMPMLAMLLAKHGFKCTVLFSMDKEGKVVLPTNQGSLSYAEALDSADMIFMSIRFRNWPEETMAKFQAALDRGVALAAMRTSTHAFKFPGDHPYKHYSFNSKEKWKGGFGREILGESWVSHHGVHKVEGCRTVTEEAQKENPILNGVESIFVTADVYEADPQEPATILLRGLVTKTLEPDSAPVEAKNNPAQPVAWTREYKNEAGTTNAVFTTTMGASVGLMDENLRRLLVNAAHAQLGLVVPEKADVTLPEGYKPTMFSFGNFKAGFAPVDFLPNGKAHLAPVPEPPAKKGKAKKAK